MSFGAKIKDLRISNNLTQLEFAQKLKLSKSNISKYEANFVEPSLETLTEIANLFNVTVDYLLGRDVSEQNPTEAKNNLTTIERNILNMFRELNPEGQDAALAMLSGLAAQPIYKKDLPNISTNYDNTNIRLVAEENNSGSPVIKKSPRLSK